MKRILIFLPMLFAVGCHGQIQPTNHVVSLTWTPAAASGSWTGCTTAAPCTYVVSRITVSAGATSCPAANVATPNYTPLNVSSPVSGATYTDSAASGLTACYIVQTEQGSSVSVPSNVAGPFVVPASPLAPSLNGQAALNAAPLVPQGDSPAPVLSAKLTAVLR